MSVCMDELYLFSMYVSMHVYMYMCMYVDMYMCIYVFMFVSMNVAR